jgi:hypothetical protein
MKAKEECWIRCCITAFSPLKTSLSFLKRMCIKAIIVIHRLQLYYVEVYSYDSRNHQDGILLDLLINRLQQSDFQEDEKYQIAAVEARKFTLEEVVENR